MKKGTKWLFLAGVLSLILAAVLTEHRTPSFGQQTYPTPNRKPACTIFCGDGSFNTINLFPPRSAKCWGGPLPADGAGDAFNGMSEENKNMVCQSLKSAGKADSACPVFKKLKEICRERESPDDQSKDKKCEKPRSPWLGSPPTDCKDFQSWQVEQTGGTVSLYICGYNVFSNTEVGKDPLFSQAYIGALKDSVRNTIGEKLCCDTLREAARTGVPCDPRKDVDCDGKPNSADHDGTFPTINLNYTTAESAKVDPFPWGMFVGEIYPNQFSCKECQWELMRGELKCSPDGKQQHVYQARWKCPSTGVEADTFKYAPATAPCKK